VDPRIPVFPAPPPVPVPASPAADERDLIAAVLRRDRKAAARFVAVHIDAIHSYVRHRLSPRVDLADDVVQDVFLAALNSLSAFEGQSSLRVWLLGIARHKIQDVYRSRLRAADALDPLDPLENDVRLSAPALIEEDIDAARAQARARSVLARLPDRYGLMLLWRYWEQRSTRDIAAAIGASEKAVERTLARARERFKDLWLKEDRRD
jgi:RNA polymerase sigma-70 factor, ECF subfamily